MTMAVELGYFTIPLPDIAKGMTFYGALFGWTFDADGPYAHVNNTKLPLGLNTGKAADLSPFYFRVDDAVAYAAKVKALGGTAAGITQSPSGLGVQCTDDQGTKFALWQAAEGY
jgi:predicted enzyme related to lactoylglutathione lyase